MIKGVLKIAAAAGACLAMSGCVMTINTVKPDMTAYQADSDAFPPLSTSNHSYFIRNVTDERVFERYSSDFSQPTWVEDEARKPLAFARQRNGGENAMGAIILPEDLPPVVVMRQVITRALLDTGRKVVTDEKNIGADTKIVDVAIKQFWTWGEIRFFHCHFTGEIETDISVDGARPVIYRGKFHKSAGGQSDATWKLMIEGAMRNYYENMTETLRKHPEL